MLASPHNSRRYVTLDGVVLPVISGGDGEPVVPPPADPPVVDPPAAPKTFTQDEVDRIVGREKAAATRAAEQKLATDLGVPLAEAKQILADQQAAQQAAMTEADRKLAQAASETAAAAASTAAAAAATRQANITVALARAGITSARVASLVDLELADGTADEAGIGAAIEAIKADTPALFAPAAPAAGTTTPPPPNGDPRGKPPAGGPGTVDQIAQRNTARLAARGLIKPTADQSA